MEEPSMTTVTYDVVVQMTVTVDAEDLIEESARSLIECNIDGIGMADIHDIEISAAWAAEMDRTTQPPRL